MPNWRKCASGSTLRRLHVRIGRQIVGRVEAGRRIASLVPAGLMVVIERVDAGRLHVRIGREIAVGVEQRVRIAPFLPAGGLEMLERIDVRRRDVRIVLQVIDVVEAVRGEQLARRERLAALLAPNCRKCASGSTCAAATSGLASRYARGSNAIEGTRPSFQPDWSKCAADRRPPPSRPDWPRDRSRSRRTRSDRAPRASRTRDSARRRRHARSRRRGFANSRTGRRPARRRHCCSPCRR